MATHTINSDCGVLSTSFNCVSNACDEITGTGGDFASLALCQSSGCGDTSWNCVSNNCTEVNGNGGDFSTETQCLADGCEDVCSGVVQITATVNSDCTIGTISASCGTDTCCQGDIEVTYSAGGFSNSTVISACGGSASVNLSQLATGLSIVGASYTGTNPGCSFQNSSPVSC